MKNVACRFMALARVALFIVGASTFDLARADIRLPKLTGDHMVLQRDTPLRIWGWAEPGEKVSVDFRGQQRVTTTAADGTWSVELPPMSPGGPDEMTLRGKNTVTLHDILVGDVWVASGQSNMEFPLQPEGEWKTGIRNSAQVIAAAVEPEIRLYHLPHQSALRPQVDANSDGWAAVTPATVGGFSAVAYFFGRELHQRHQVPIGLIQATWDGTVAEAWVSDRALRRLPRYATELEALRGIDETRARVEETSYTVKKSAWLQQHGAEDRGRIEGGPSWADPDFKSDDWPVVIEPQREAEARWKGFDGVVWFRKTIELTAVDVGHDLLVHLPNLWKCDEAYFNGTKIGETDQGEAVRDYRVPRALVRVGRNILALRLRGSDGFVGFFDDPARTMLADPHEEMTLWIGEDVRPLSGAWSVQPGPDLSLLPPPPFYLRVRSKPNTPTLLFNAMIAPLTSHAIRGVIWYQGESNALMNRSQEYGELFTALIRDWREHWQTDVPFLFVQLAGYGANRPEPADYAWADLRGAQAQALHLPKTGMATAVDLGSEREVHPRNKQPVGHRLALVAEKLVYGEKTVASGPVLRAMKIEGNEARIEFQELGGGLVIKDAYGYIRGFEIAGADGRFHWARARRDGNDILVSSGDVPHPAAVRYAWGNLPDGNVYNLEGLPALPFRTDAASGPRHD